MSACSLAAALSVSVSSPLSAADFQEARPISQIAPAYSHDLRASCVEGDVVVSFTITPTGEVRNPALVSSTNRFLDKPTLAAVLKWKFTPAMKDGVAVSEKVVQPVAFRIPDIHPAATARLVASRPAPASQTGNSKVAD